MNRSFWAPRLGDVNGMVGLLFDNIAALVLLYTLLAAPGYRADRFSAEFVLARMIPGTVVGVLLSGVLYAILAGWLARRSGRTDVTAMPDGVDTPSVFAVSFFVLLPALTEGRDRFAGRQVGVEDLHHLASIFAWHVGA